MNEMTETELDEIEDCIIPSARESFFNAKQVIIENIKKEICHAIKNGEFTCVIVLKDFVHYQETYLEIINKILKAYYDVTIEQRIHYDRSANYDDRDANMIISWGNLSCGKLTKIFK